MIHTGDCVEVMQGMDPDSIDAIVTDPPYGLEFMGKEWDRLTPGRGRAELKDRSGFTPHKSEFKQGVGTNVGMPKKNPRCRKCGKLKFDHDKSKCRCEAPDFDTRESEYAFLMQSWHERWATEARRVAKPGAYLLAFGGTRTVHRLTVALEDAGWIIRDLLVWAYASGFPKSKASLKPAWEPIVLARKPGPLQELAIDACRIGTERGVPASLSTNKTPHTYGDGLVGVEDDLDPNMGRWPANLVLTDPIFDGDTEGVVGGGSVKSGVAVGGAGNAASIYGTPLDKHQAGDMGYGDTGTYSRFFLIPKASRSDREPVVPGDLEEGMPDNAIDRASQRSGNGTSSGRGSRSGPRRNVHPTVKPTDLMRHLVRLVTPSLSVFVPDDERIAQYAAAMDDPRDMGGSEAAEWKARFPGVVVTDLDDTLDEWADALRLEIAHKRAQEEGLGEWVKRDPAPVVLDPFIGSGTTALAAEAEGFEWIGIERESEYVKIAEQRLHSTQKGLGL